jgi:hypothetical protein
MLFQSVVAAQSPGPSVTSEPRRNTPPHKHATRSALGNQAVFRACAAGGPHTIQSLRCGIGNQATVRASTAGATLPSLVMGRPDDPMEREADAAADHVLRLSAPAPTLTVSGTHSIARQCSCCEDDATIRRHQASNAPAAGAIPPIVGEALSSPGVPLDYETKAFFEPRFQRDLSAVRVHAGGRSAEAARSINANAYTVGQDIVFDDGRYDPLSGAGRRLLAHELAHTVQQPTPGVGAIRRDIRNPRYPCYESAAMPGGMDFFGTLVHLAIQQHYISNIDSDAAREHVLPGLGRADIVDQTGGVYEIKPKERLPEARYEADAYVRQARTFCDTTVDWHLGTKYFPPPPMRINGQLVGSWLETDGAILYTRLSERDPDGIPLPPPGKQPQKLEKESQKAKLKRQKAVAREAASDEVPASAWRRIAEFAKDVYDRGLDANEAAEQFLRKHPELVGIVIVAGLAAIVVTLADDVTLVGIADDVLLLIFGALEWTALRLSFAL